MSIQIDACAFDKQYRKVVTVEELAEIFYNAQDDEIIFFNGDLDLDMDEDNCDCTIWYGMKSTHLFDEDNLIAFGCLGGGYTRTYETPIIDTDVEWIETTTDFIRHYIKNGIDFDDENKVVICTYYLDK